MINQETLYQLLLKEKWGEILDIIYKEKDYITNDLLLNFAAKTFESEFLSKVKNCKIDNKDILENIEKFYLLHHGKFYMLSDENYKINILKNCIPKSILIFQKFISSLYKHVQGCIGIWIKYILLEKLQSY